MSSERVEKDAGKESAAKKVADMDSLCEEISRAIVEGLVEKQILDEPELAPPPENLVAETTVIAPLENLQADRMVTAVENLLESDEISQRIVRLVQEKIEQVLNEDVVQCRHGDSGVIAERVHLECTRLFARESFRTDVVNLLKNDVEQTVAPVMRRDVTSYLQEVLTEVTSLLVERVTGVLRGMREITLAPAPRAAAAPDVAPSASPAENDGAPVSPAAVQEGETLVLVVAPEADALPASAGRAFRDADARKVADTYARIRERLWWDGVR